MPKFLSILSPTRLETVVYLVLSGFGLLLFNLVIVTEALVDPSVSELGISILRDQALALLAVVDGMRLTGALSLAIFWGIFGLAIYVIGFTAHEVWSNIRQDIDEASDKTHHPQYFNRQQWIGQTMLRTLVRLTALIGIMVYTFLFIGFILPLSVQLFRDIAHILERPVLALNPFIGILLLALALHVFVVLMRLLLLKRRIGGEIEMEEE